MQVRYGWVLLIWMAMAACGAGDPTPPGRDPATELGKNTSQPDTPSASRIVAGEQLSCIVGASVFCRGGNPFLRRGSLVEPASEFVLEIDADQLALGDHHGCVLLKGEVLCWGSNLMGQLGEVAAKERCIDRPCSSEMVSIGGLPAIRGIAAGAFHTLALSEDGTVWGWGANSFSQGGEPAQRIQDSAKQVGGVANAVAVAAAGQQSFAVLGDGSVVAWGNPGSGRLGSVTDDPFVSRPTAIQGLSRPAVQIAAGAEHACALLEDGTVECWGGNRFGQLGDGTTDPRPNPAPVTGLVGAVSEVVAGGYFTCARNQHGQVMCWGWNDNGQLGQGSFEGPAEPGGFSASADPVEVRGLPGPAASLSAGNGFACASTDGSPWCWGRNEAGQLGDASLQDHATPVQVGRAITPRPAAEEPAISATTSGIDVSYHSGRVDWKKIESQGFGFAFTLSTAGLDFHDPFFDAHWERMNRIRRGAYHFFVAHDDPARQAHWFIANTPLQPGDLAPVVDIETLGDDPPDNLRERLNVFGDIVYQHYGVRPIVYTGPNFWNQNLGGGWGDHPLWIAEYEVEAPKIPDGWARWTLWQHRGNSDLDGAERVVDLNRAAEGLHFESLQISASAAGINSEAATDRR